MQFSILLMQLVIYHVQFSISPVKLAIYLMQFAISIGIYHSYLTIHNYKIPISRKSAIGSSNEHEPKEMALRSRKICSCLVVSA